MPDDLIRSKEEAAFLKKNGAKNFFIYDTGSLQRQWPKGKSFLPHPRPGSFCSQKEVLPGHDSLIRNPP
jgi:hypothetical protein